MFSKLSQPLAVPPALKWLLLLLFGGLSLHLYSKLIGLMPVLLPLPDERRHALLMLNMHAFLTSAALALLLCLPLAMIYRRHAVGAAVVVSLPLLVMQLLLSRMIDAPAASIIMRLYELLAHAVLLIGCTLAARYRLARLEPAPDSAAGP